MLMNPQPSLDCTKSTPKLKAVVMMELLVSGHHFVSARPISPKRRTTLLFQTLCRGSLLHPSVKLILTTKNFHCFKIPLAYKLCSAMMSQGRGSANRAIVTVALLLIIHACLGNVRAATYTVGDSNGWTFNVDSWPKGKRFRAGDVLVFNYDSTIHNVVAVNRGGYASCRTPAGAKVYNSGKDQIKLAKGQNFFICNTAGHCESGMKIAVTAV